MRGGGEGGGHVGGGTHRRHPAVRERADTPVALADGVDRLVRRQQRRDLADGLEILPPRQPRVVGEREQPRGAHEGDVALMQHLHQPVVEGGEELARRLSGGREWRGRRGWSIERVRRRRHLRLLGGRQAAPGVLRRTLRLARRAATTAYAKHNSFGRGGIILFIFVFYSLNLQSPIKQNTFITDFFGGNFENTFLFIFLFNIHAGMVFCFLSFRKEETKLVCAISRKSIFS